MSVIGSTTVVEVTLDSSRSFAIKTCVFSIFGNFCSLKVPVTETLKP